jgi:hypothetical protein
MLFFEKLKSQEYNLIDTPDPNRVPQFAWNQRLNPITTRGMIIQTQNAKHDQEPKCDSYLEINHKR